MSEMPGLEQMARDHFNEPVLLEDRLARVIGYGEDEQDAYLICQETRTTWDEPGRVIWHTCVGGYVFLDRLKEQVQIGEWDDFMRLDSLLELNGAPKQAEFRCQLWPPESGPKTGE